MPGQGQLKSSALRFAPAAARHPPSLSGLPSQYGQRYRALGCVNLVFWDSGLGFRGFGILNFGGSRLRVPHSSCGLIHCSSCSSAKRKWIQGDVVILFGPTGRSAESRRNRQTAKPKTGQEKLGVPSFGVLTIRILLLRVLY